MKKIFMLIACVLLLTACSGKNKNVVCKTENEYYSSVSTYEADSDGKITKVKYETYVSVKDMEMTEEEFEEQKESSENLYADIDGVEYEMTLEDEEVVIVMEVDVSKIDEDTKSMLSLQFENLDEQVKQEEESGLTCE